MVKKDDRENVSLLESKERPLWGTAIAYVAFCLLMFRALVLRDHLVGVWRSRRIGSTRWLASKGENSLSPTSATALRHITINKL